MFNPGLRMTLFRSEELSLIQLYFPSEVAEAAVFELGELGIIQFRDLNENVNAFQRTFISELRRLDEMERKIRFLRAQTKKAEIPIRPLDTSKRLARSHKDIDELENNLKQASDRIHQLSGSHELLLKRQYELSELRHILRETSRFLDNVKEIDPNVHQTRISGISTDEMHSNLLLHSNDIESPSTESAPAATSLSWVAGVIPRHRLPILQRLLWRALRGNLYMNSVEIEEGIYDPNSLELVKKDVFLVFGHGKESIAKISKLCESLSATLYSLSSEADARREAALEVIARIEDVNNVIFNTNQALRNELIRLSEFITEWENIIKREKLMYHTMNYFGSSSNNNEDAKASELKPKINESMSLTSITRSSLIAEGWVPSESISEINAALSRASESVNSQLSPLLSIIPTSLTPPTYHKTNKFTSVFQGLIDAYGVASYREINPGLFTIISFPFLFSIMFGDVGHGFIMGLFAFWMILYEKKLKNYNGGEIWDIFFGGRYIIVLMGLFSIYTGLLYNDVFSRNLHFAPSGFKTDATSDYYQWNDDVVYPFGIDPAWHHASNMLIFLNSYKMKMAILLGFIHMMFGIILSGVNNYLFTDYISLLFETLPQVIFMSCLFGYLCILIIFKWCLPHGNLPGLLNMFIDMILSPGSVEDPPFYTGQAIVQTVLLLIAVCCVPVMLFGKPYMLRREYMKKKAIGYSTMNRRGSDDGIGSSSASTDSEEMHHSHKTGSEVEFVFSDVMVHQAIHSSEFVLGSVSNTASYLRLWALSLAHAQLSDVLWIMVIQNSALSGNNNPFLAFMGFGLWFGATVSILVLMEGLSAFLHALRLHWVEFNGKFYKGGGILFVPFSFKHLQSSQQDSNGEQEKE